jgi:hypothetical protein
MTDKAIPSTQQELGTSSGAPDQAAEKPSVKKKAAIVTAPQIGDIVGYTLPDGAHPGDIRPALIVRTWGDTSDARVNLQVFTDGTNDYPANHAGATGILWQSSVANDEDTKASGTYHRLS